MKQKTIKNIINFSGIGLHSAVKVNVRLLPNYNNNGIIFKRKDKNNSEIIANFKNVVDTKLGTTISNGEEKVLTIEHLMSAIWACDIDNLIIEIDNQEVPILDGSSYIFIEEIKKAGIQELNINRKYLKILKTVEFIDDDKFIKLIPSNNFNVDLTVEFNYGNIGRQHFIFNGNKDIFIKDIAKAKTFCNQKEIDYMKSIGLARGGSLDNAVVFSDNGIVNKDSLIYKNDGVARHKLLDCIGDMYTCGYNLICNIVSFKGGHTLNNEILKKLFNDKNNYEIVEL